MNYVATIAGRDISIEIEDEHHVMLNGISYTVDFEVVGDQPVYSLLLDGKSYEAYVYPADEGWQVVLLGSLYQIQVEDEREKRLRASLGNRLIDQTEYHLKSPMPGMVVSIPVHDGQVIAKGEVLVILESMKMQNELKAPRAGIVARCRVEVGDSVEYKETLLSVV